jgi:hypothetical protein
MTWDGDSAEEPRLDSPHRLRRDGSASVDSRMERVDKALAGLDNELDRIGERLLPVLGPERPSPALAGGGSSDEPGSDLGRALEHYADRMQALTSRLSYLTDRLDL